MLQEILLHKTCFKLIRQLIKSETKIFTIMKTFTLLQYTNIFFFLYLHWIFTEQFVNKAKQIVLSKKQNKCCLVIYLLLILYYAIQSQRIRFKIQWKHLNFGSFIKKLKFGILIPIIETITKNLLKAFI